MKVNLIYASDLHSTLGSPKCIWEILKVVPGRQERHTDMRLKVIIYLIIRSNSFVLIPHSGEVK